VWNYLLQQVEGSGHGFFFFNLMRHDASAQNASPKKIRKFFFLFKRRHVGVFGCTIQEINLHLTFTLNPSGSYEFGSTRGYDFFFSSIFIR
jgi:hypothetical protein